eukprot:scaffold7099_cov131-Isochrysis_galbana.AAC.23
MDGEIMGKGSESRRVVRHGVSRRVAASEDKDATTATHPPHHAPRTTTHTGRARAEVLRKEKKTCGIEGTAAMISKIATVVETTRTYRIAVGDEMGGPATMMRTCGRAGTCSLLASTREEP